VISAVKGKPLNAPLERMTTGETTMMKRLGITVSVALMLVAGTAAAQQATDSQMQMLNQMENMSVEDLDRMATALEKSLGNSDSCLQNIDQQRLAAIKSEGSAIQSKVSALCTGGRRSEAETYVKAELQKYSNDPVILKLKSCAQDVKVDIGYLNRLITTPASADICQ